MSSEIKSFISFTQQEHGLTFNMTSLSALIKNEVGGIQQQDPLRGVLNIYLGTEPVITYLPLVSY